MNEHKIQSIEFVQAMVHLLDQYHPEINDKHLVMLALEVEAFITDLIYNTDKLEELHNASQPQSTDQSSL